MANLGCKNGVHLSRFRNQSRESKRSLKTADRTAADAAMPRTRIWAAPPVLAELKAARLLQNPGRDSAGHCRRDEG